MKHALTERWNACSPREQGMLVLMAVAILAFAYAFGALAPLKTWSAEARERHARALAEEQALAPYLAALRDTPVRDEAKTPDATALADSARVIGLVVLEVETIGREVQLTLAPSPPDRLFAWLEQQRLAGHGPRVARLDPEAPGVRATLRF